MKTFASYVLNGNEIGVVAPESHSDFNYLCNLARAQHMYIDENSIFYKLLGRERNYIRHITAITIDDEMYGLSLIWDYAKRAVNLNRVESEEKLFEYGFLRHAIGTYIGPKYRRGKVGSLITNFNLQSFEEPVFCHGATEVQQRFWASPRIDKTFLKFMLIGQTTTKIDF